MTSRSQAGVSLRRVIAAHGRGALHVLLVFSLGMTSGCAGVEQVDQAEDYEELAAAAVRTGVDYSWDRPSPTQLFSLGYTFAFRYLSHTASKNLTKAEADKLIAAGLDVVSNWQTSANRPLVGYSGGAADAAEADRQARAAGMPAHRPIYFSVDFDGTVAQQPAVNAYMDGVASVIGRERTGAYAGYHVLKRLLDAGKVAWGWQTYAWSAGNWDPRAHVRQVKNNVTVAGGQVDINHAQVVDFGQWGRAPVLTDCGGFTTQGGIEAKYASLGGCSGFLGAPLTNETATPDQVGRYNHFQNGGSIYWSPSTGAYEVHGGIREKWEQLGWEGSLLGYPTSDETATGCKGGRYNNFQNGAITWEAAAGAHETHGPIRARWQALGFECSYLGFPTTDQYAVAGGSRQDYQGGYITLDASGVATDHK